MIPNGSQDRPSSLEAAKQKTEVVEARGRAGAEAAALSPQFRESEFQELSPGGFRCRKGYRGNGELDEKTPETLYVANQDSMVVDQELPLRNNNIQKFTAATVAATVVLTKNSTSPEPEDISPKQGIILDTPKEFTLKQSNRGGASHQDNSQVMEIQVKLRQQNDIQKNDGALQTSGKDQEGLLEKIKQMGLNNQSRQVTKQESPNPFSSSHTSPKVSQPRFQTFSIQQNDQKVTLVQGSGMNPRDASISQTSQKLSTHKKTVSQNPINDMKSSGHPSPRGTSVPAHPGPVSGFNKQYDVTYVNQLNPQQNATIPQKIIRNMDEISIKNLEQGAGGSFVLRKKSKVDKLSTLELNGVAMQNQKINSNRSNNSVINAASSFAQNIGGPNQPSQLFHQFKVSAPSSKPSGGFQTLFTDKSQKIKNEQIGGYSQPRDTVIQKPRGSVNSERDEQAKGQNISTQYAPVLNVQIPQDYVVHPEHLEKSTLHNSSAQKQDYFVPVSKVSYFMVPPGGGDPLNTQSSPLKNRNTLVPANVQTQSPESNPSKNSHTTHVYLRKTQKEVKGGRNSKLLSPISIGKNIQGVTKKNGQQDISLYDNKISSLDQNIEENEDQRCDDGLLPSQKPQKTLKTPLETLPLTINLSPGDTSSNLVQRVKMNTCKNNSAISDNHQNYSTISYKITKNSEMNNVMNWDINNHMDLPDGKYSTIQYNHQHTTNQISPFESRQPSPSFHLDRPLPQTIQASSNASKRGKTADLRQWQNNQPLSYRPTTQIQGTTTNKDFWQKRKAQPGSKGRGQNGLETIMQQRNLYQPLLSHLNCVHYNTIGLQKQQFASFKSGSGPACHTPQDLTYTTQATQKILPLNALNNSPLNMASSSQIGNMAEQRNSMIFNENRQVQQNIGTKDQSIKQFQTLNDKVFTANLIKNFPSSNLTKDIYRQNVIKKYLKTKKKARNQLRSSCSDSLRESRDEPVSRVAGTDKMRCAKPLQKGRGTAKSELNQRNKGSNQIKNGQIGVSPRSPGVSIISQKQEVEQVQKIKESGSVQVKEEGTSETDEADQNIQRDSGVYSFQVGDSIDQQNGQYIPYHLNFQNANKKLRESKPAKFNSQRSKTNKGSRYVSSKGQKQVKDNSHQQRKENHVIQSSTTNQDIVIHDNESLRQSYQVQRTDASQNFRVLLTQRDSKNYGSVVSSGSGPIGASRFGDAPQVGKSDSVGTCPQQLNTFQEEQANPRNDQSVLSMARGRNPGKLLTPVQEKHFANLIFEMEQLSASLDYGLKDVIKSSSDKIRQSTILQASLDEKDLEKLQQQNQQLSNMQNEEVSTYFKKRQQNCIKIFEQEFKNKPFAKKYGIPQVIEQLFFTVFDAQIKDQTKLLNYFQSIKALQDFQLKQNETKNIQLINQIKQYQQKEADQKDFMKNIQNKPRAYQAALDEYEKTKGILELDPKQQFIHDEFSGANTLLEQTIMNMSQQCGMNFDILDKRMDTLPVGQMEIIVNKHSSYLQKRTAFKVLQRYFKQGDNQDQSTQVNLDEQFKKQIDTQIETIYQLNQLINKIERKSLDLEDQVVKANKNVERYKNQKIDLEKIKLQLEKEIEQFNKQFNSRDDQTKNLNLQIRQLGFKNSDLLQEISEKCQEIVKKDKIIKDKEQQLQDMQQINNENIMRHKSEIDQSKLAIKKLKELLEQKVQNFQNKNNKTIVNMQKKSQEKGLNFKVNKQRKEDVEDMEIDFNSFENVYEVKYNKVNKELIDTKGKLVTVTKNFHQEKEKVNTLQREVKQHKEVTKKLKKEINEHEKESKKRNQSDDNSVNRQRDRRRNKLADLLGSIDDQDEYKQEMMELHGEVTKIVGESALPSENKGIVLKHVLNNFQNKLEKATQTLELWNPDPVRRSPDPMIYAYSYESAKKANRNMQGSPSGVMNQSGQIQNSMSANQFAQEIMRSSKNGPPNMIQSITSLNNDSSPIRKGKIMKGTTLQFANNLKSSLDHIADKGSAMGRQKLREQKKNNPAHRSRPCMMSPQHLGGNSNQNILGDIKQQLMSNKVRRSFIHQPKAKNLSMFNFDRVILNAQPSQNDIIVEDADQIVNVRDLVGPREPSNNSNILVAPTNKTESVAQLPIEVREDISSPQRQFQN